MRCRPLLLVLGALLLPAAAHAQRAVPGVDGAGTLVVDVVDAPEGPKERYALETHAGVIHVPETPGMAEAAGSQVLLRDGRVVAAAAAKSLAPMRFRTLVLPLTASGFPLWTTTQIAAAFGGGATSLDGFLSLSTDGAYRLTPTVAPWLTIPGGAGCNGFEAAADAAARTAGFDPAAYDRVVYLTAWPCAEADGRALMFGRLIWLYRSLHPGLVAHELGHTLGLEHANLLRCSAPAGRPLVSASGCSELEYGDPLDTMGAPNDLTLLSTFNRLKAGILLGAEQRVRSTTTVQLDAASTGGTTLLQVPRKRAGTPVTQFYALEVRDRGTIWDPFAPDGVTVRIVPGVASTASPVLLDMHPESFGARNAPLLAGEAFEDPEYGIALEVLDFNGDQATVAVTAPGLPDDVAPDAPGGFVASRVSGGVALQWSPVTDDDSGTVAYRLERDGALIATPPGTAHLDPVAGAHGYAVRAVDAAGNVGAPARTRATGSDGPQPPGPPAPPPRIPVARDTTKPTLTLSPKVGKRPVRLPGRRLRITGRDDRAGARVLVTVAGRPVGLRRGMLRLTGGQARSSTVRILVTDAAGNRIRTTLRIRSGRARLIA